MFQILGVVAFVAASSPGPTNSFTAPEALNAGSVFFASDYPKRALANNEGGFARYEATVDPTGKVERCDLLVETGVRELDSATCRLISSRARFKPALDADGQPTFGVVRAWNSWQVGKWLYASRPRSFDLSLALNRLPSNLASPTYVSVVAAVDDAGRMKACHSSGTGHESKLGELACAQVVALKDWSPAKTKSGTPVSSVQLITVQFNAAASP
ncbi:MAG: TonB family protein [Sphingomicrobium sp.]